MSMIAKSTWPVTSSFAGSVPADGTRTCSVIPSPVSNVRASAL